MVAEHLLELGHKRIGLINGPIRLKPCAERRSSFVEVLAERGFELAAAHDLETAEMTIEAGEAAAARLFDQRLLPTALFCTNDLLALGAERAALAKGLRVPGDLAIVGNDDIRFAATSLVPLTTVRNPSYELGYESARLLVDEATNGLKHRHRRLLFEPELIVRASTAAVSRSANGRRARSRAVASP
jgi:LacI family transcriptional regulator